MADRHSLHLECDISGSPEIVRSVKEFDSLHEAAATAFEFIKEFGEPDQGTQSLTLVLVSSRK